MNYIFYLAIIYLSSFALSEISTEQNIKNKIESNYYSFDENYHFNLIDSIKYKESVLSEENYNLYLGFEFHTVGKIIYNSNPDLALESFESSINYLERLIELNKKAEYLALLSSALGKKASLSSLTSFYWAIKSKNRFFEAYELDSNNRKVLLIAAIHLMHIPEIYGGDKAKSKELLEKALTLPTVDFPVLWARDEEIYAYLAQLEILKQNKLEALDYIKKSKSFVDNYGFIEFDLLPQLEKID